jgi:hypothetical protein
MRVVAGGTTLLTRTRPLLIALALLLHAALAAQAPVAPLVGTVLAPDGRPIAGASVTVSRCDGRLFLCLDQDLRNEWVEVARTRTDKAGRFGLQLPLGLALRVEVDHAPFARWRDEALVPGEPVTVRLEAACSFAGRLVDAGTGKGTPGLLTAWHSQTRSELFRGRTDAEGRFAFDRLPSGPLTCDVEPDVVQPPERLHVTLDAGERHERTFELATGTVITGTVTDAVTGAPIANASIGEGWKLRRAVRTGADGRYELRGHGAPGYADLHCTAAGHARAAARHPVHEKATTGIDFALAPGVAVVGQVVDPAGAPVAGAYVAAIGLGFESVPWHAARTDANGAFRCDGFPRGRVGVLLVRCAGWASLTYHLPAPAGDGQIDFGIVRLRAPRVVQGTLVDANDAPRAGARVALHGVNADATWLAPVPAAWPHLARYVGEREVRTDASGRFAFGDVAAGEYELCFVDPVSGPLRLATVAVAAAVDPAPVRLIR